MKNATCTQLSKFFGLDNSGKSLLLQLIEAQNRVASSGDTINDSAGSSKRLFRSICDSLLCHLSFSTRIKYAIVHCYAILQVYYLQLADYLPHKICPRSTLETSLSYCKIIQATSGVTVDKLTLNTSSDISLHR